MRALAPLLLAALALAACEGGCGDPPAPQRVPEDKTRTMSAAPSGGGGGQAIPINPRERSAADLPPSADLKSQPAPGQVTGRPVPPSESKPAPAEAKAPEVKDLGRLETVAPAEFEARVLRRELPVLVVYSTGGCRPCAKAEFAAASIAGERKGKNYLVKVDLDAPGAGALLPKGLSRLPVPSFALYQAGAAVSLRQTPPVPPERTERLKAWLRRSLDARDLGPYTPDGSSK